MLKRTRRTRLSTRRRLTRKSANRLAVRKNIKASVGSSKRPPMHFHVVHDIFQVKPSPVDQAIEIAVNPTTSQRFPQYAGLYDYYRVISATFDFIPDITVSNTKFDAGAGQIVQWNQGNTFLKYDKDDDTPCAGLQQAIIENYADRPSMRRFRYTVKPPKHMQLNDLGEPQFGYHSTNDNTVDDGWLKLYLSPNPDVNANYDVWMNGYTIIVKYLVIFKDYTVKAQSTSEINLTAPAKLLTDSRKELTV